MKLWEALPESTGLVLFVLLAGEPSVIPQDNVSTNELVAVTFSMRR